MDRLDVFQQCSLYALFNPPRSIRAESHAAVGIEIIDCPYQTEVTLFYQVSESHPTTGVFLRNIDYQPEIASHQLFSGRWVVFFSDKFT
jgi:hypothetical protein